jgi:hypothetical protein
VQVEVAIMCWPWGAYLGDDALTKGVRLKISSWTRHDHNIMPPAAKTTGNYVNSSLAKVEALRAGYDEAVMLAGNGLVAECSGENVFVSRHGRLITPPLSAGALEGITQHTVMTLAGDLGYDAVCDNLARSDLYIADEMFLVGNRSRGELGQLGRRPCDPVPRPEDDGDRRPLRPRRPRPGRSLPGLVRTRRLSAAPTVVHVPAGTRSIAYDRPRTVMQPRRPNLRTFHTITATTSAARSDAAARRTT